jgi:hypothetical protein
VKLIDGRSQCVEPLPAAEGLDLPLGDMERHRVTLNLGLRWDYYSPSSEKYDRLEPIPTA